MEETDGSPLTDLTGYKIILGYVAGRLSKLRDLGSPGRSDIRDRDLTPGTYYLVATAFDSDGVESEYSDEGGAEAFS